MNQPWKSAIKMFLKMIKNYNKVKTWENQLNKKDKKTIINTNQS